MKNVIQTLFILLGFIALLTFFFIEAQVVEIKDEEQRVHNAISDLQKLNIRIDHKVDRARFGVLQHYDSINEDIQSIEKVLSLLSGDQNEHGRVIVENSKTRAQLSTLERLTSEKRQAIERFKSENAILRNSVAFFTREARELSDELLVSPDLDQAQRGQIGKILHRIVQDIILLNKAPSRQLQHTLGNNIILLAEQSELLPSALNDRFDDLIHHSLLISEYTSRVTTLVEDVFTVPVEYTSRLLEAEHEKVFTYLMGRSNIFRTYLFVFSLVLVASIIVLVVQLQRGASALGALNENLENEVHERQLAELELRKSQERLEEIVRNRTADLEKTNRLLSREIEEQDKAQRQLKMLTRAIEAVSEGIVVSSAPYPDIGLLYANPAFTDLTGFTAQEVLHKNCSFLQGPETDKEAVASIRKAIIEGRRVRTIIRNYHKDGTPFWNDLTITPIRDADGKITNFVGVQNDISELKETQERLVQAKQDAEKANQAKSDFLAAMSHEIRTPMNVIVGMSDLLEEAPLSGEQRGFLDTIRNAGDNLLQLINDILDLSKIESGKLELEKTAFNLPEMVRQTCNLIELKTREKNLSLDLYVEADVPAYALGDPGRLRQILINLLGNAVKFTESGGLTVKVRRLEEHNEYVVIEFVVADTGIGITEEQRGKIFDSFTQADASTTRKHGGTGLGLSICKRLVEMHGGSISVTSTLGKGSEFVFTAHIEMLADQTGLPDDMRQRSRNDRLKVAAPEGPRRSLTAADDKPETLYLLLVEDNKDNRMLIQAFLKKSPYRIIHATNGQEGVEQFMKRPFDLVLMDMQMPVMDGYSATRAIRKLEKERGTPPTPIIAFTAHALVGDREKCLEAGCDEHLIKPVKKKALLEMLDTYRMT